MKKVFDQTLRDIKREVNKKVLKVPGIEQKVLDATSNEPWGPHGTLLADIAHASRNYHEYQMIMTVIWKRINDTGKNWRHVYKALTVLEYLVANGSERVIDEIREHAYQISTLSDFQYIDSSGRDQGNNVRRKSQSLVALVNDKDRIIEAREKAAANREKFRNTSAGGMYRPNSYSSTGVYGDRYDDERYEGRYGSRDEDKNGYGYGREREYSYRDGDRYDRYGDRYGRDYEERYGRDGYRDDDSRERSPRVNDYGSRGRSSDRDRDHTFEDDAQSSSRGSGARADDQSHDGSIARRLERKFSEQNIGALPTYEEAIGESRSPGHSERNGETSAAPAPGSSSPPAPRASPPAPTAASPSASNNCNQGYSGISPSASPADPVAKVADEFDPRGPFSATPASTAAPTALAVSSTANNAEMDLLGSLSDSFAPNPLAIMPVTPATTISKTDSQANFSVSSFAATQPLSNGMHQPFEDPFGDSPFRAIPSMDAVSAQQQTFVSAAPYPPSADQHVEMPPVTAPNAGTVNSFDYGSSFSAVTYPAPNVQPPSANSQFLPQEPSPSHQEADILADILPPSVPSPVINSEAGFSAPTGQPAYPSANIYGNYNSQAGSVAPIASSMGPQPPQFHGGNFLPHGGPSATIPSTMGLQTPARPASQFNNGNPLPQQASTTPHVPSDAYHSTPGTAPQFNSGNFPPQQGSASPVGFQVPYQTPTGLAGQQNDVLGDLFSKGPTTPMASQPSLPSSAGSLATVPQTSKDKFETKSTVWADTMSRGLVNLNISGPKINPLSDIGIDFDALNRKEKRMEKPTTTAVTSTITMGKAMGSGSGIGRAGAGAFRAPPNPMMGSGMGMGMGMNMGMGMGGSGLNMGMSGAPGSHMGMGSYGGMSQPMGMGMGMNMAMNMGMGQGGPMQPSTGLPPGLTVPGGYNPMMGTGGYPQQPYGGGYQ